MMKKAFVVLLLVSALGAELSAQGHGAAPAPAAAGQAPEHEAAELAQEAAPGPADVIMPHITDSKHLEFPWFYSRGNWAGHVTLPTWNVTIAGKTFDMGPTKHVVYLALAAIIAAILVIGTARAHARHTHAVGRPRGFAA